MATPLVASAVASSQTAIVDTANQLVADNSITMASLSQVVVAPFGANQFLVSIVYS